MEKMNLEESEVRLFFFFPPHQDISFPLPVMVESQPSRIFCVFFIFGQLYGFMYLP